MTKGIKVTKLHTEFFVRYALLTEAERKTMKTMFLGKSQVPYAAGVVGGDDVGLGVEFDDKGNHRYYSTVGNTTDNPDYEGSSVMDDSEDEDDMPETESFEKRMIGRVTQEIDDAIASKGLITDRATQDSLMNYIIQATKLAVKDAAQQGELDGITQEEYDNLIRDIVESSYNSLVHKIGALDTSLLTDPRRLSFDEYMRNGGGV